MTSSTDETRDRLRAFLALAAIDDAPLEWLVNSVEPRDFVAGDTLVDEHAPTRECYFILEGTTEVSVGGSVLGESRSEDIEGELAMLFGTRRSATVRALTDVRTLVLSSEGWDRATRDRPELAGVLRAAIGNVHDIDSSADDRPFLRLFRPRRYRRRLRNAGAILGPIARSAKRLVGRLGCRGDRGRMRSRAGRLHNNRSAPRGRGHESVARLLHVSTSTAPPTAGLRRGMRTGRRRPSFRLRAAVCLGTSIAVMFCAPAPRPTASTKPPATIDAALGNAMRGSSANARLAAFVHGSRLEAVETAVRKAGATTIARFGSVAVVAVLATPDQLHEIARDPAVDFLESNRPVSFSLDTAHGATRNDSAVSGFRAGRRNVDGLDGRGTTIAILDTGVDGSHPMFQHAGRSKVIRNLKLLCAVDPAQIRCSESVAGTVPPRWIDLTTTTNDSDTATAGGHGTHVAGITAGVEVETTHGLRIRGAAPGASLVGLGIGAANNIFGAALGLQWVLENHRAPCGRRRTPSCWPIKVVNNSFQVTSLEAKFEARGVVAKLTRALIRQGVTIVWSAGNGGGSGARSLTNPAGHDRTPGILMVGNYDDGGAGSRDNVLSPASSRGDRNRPSTYPDVIAPGTSILSACRSTITVCLGGRNDPAYGYLSGTSMSAPYLAGVVAQLLQADRTLTPAAIEDILEDSAYKPTTGAAYRSDPLNADDATSYDKGHGLVDVVAAVSRAMSRVPSALPRQCAPSGHLVTDRRGDHGAVVTSLDLRDAWFDWSNDRLTIRMTVDGLAPNQPSVPDREIVASFDFASRSYDMVARPAGASGWSFSLRRADGRPMAVTVRGQVTRGMVLMRFDTQVFSAALRRESRSAPALSRGSFIGPFRLSVEQRAATSGVVLDEAASGCFIRAGTGPTVRPKNWASLPLDLTGRLRSHTPAVRWSGSAVLAASEATGCRSLTGSACDDRFVAVDERARDLKLQVDVAVPRATLGDFDLYVFDPHGALVGASENTSAGESLLIDVVTSGVYRIRVEAYAAVVANYTGRAALVARAA
jgi:serine protease AprX